MEVQDMQVQLALAFGPDVKEELVEDNGVQEPEVNPEGQAENDSKKPKRVLSRRDTLIAVRFCDHSNSVIFQHEPIYVWCLGM